MVVVAAYGSTSTSSPTNLKKSYTKEVRALVAVFAVATVVLVATVTFTNISNNDVDHQVELALGPGLESDNALAVRRLETEFPCTKDGKYYGTKIPFVYKTFGFNPCKNKGRYLSQIQEMPKKDIPFFLQRKNKKKWRALRRKAEKKAGKKKAGKRSRARGNRCGKGFGNKTCEQLGRPGKCCSRWGWCGTGESYCGKGCQNGCW